MTLCLFNLKSVLGSECIRWLCQLFFINFNHGVRSCVVVLLRLIITPTLWTATNEKLRGKKSVVDFKLPWGVFVWIMCVCVDGLATSPGCVSMLQAGEDDGWMLLFYFFIYFFIYCRYKSICICPFRVFLSDDDDITWFLWLYEFL